jgi:hypothetical protein
MPNETRTPRDPRALNAYRHGLTGQVHVVVAMDQIAYDKLCRSTQEYFNPVGDFEVSMVQSVADDRWQLQRASTIEDFIFACDMGGTDPLVEDPIKNYALVRGQTWLSSGKELERIALYAQRIQRRLEKNLAMLRQLQADRKAALEKAVEEASALAELAEKAGKSYDPAKEFPREFLPANFDFSTPEITRMIAHRRGLKQAKRATPEVKNRLQNAA